MQCDWTYLFVSGVNRCSNDALEDEEFCDVHLGAALQSVVDDAVYEVERDMRTADAYDRGEII